MFDLPCEFHPKRTLSFFLCPKCGLLFAEPVEDGLLAQAYGSLDQNQYYESTEREARIKALSSAKDVGQALLTNGSLSNCVLDIGCGFGHFMDEYKRLYPDALVAGQELPGKAISACRAKGFAVYECDLDAIPDQFSATTLLDVAEHVPNPIKTFHSLAKLLRSGGLVYIHTPRRFFIDTMSLTVVRFPLLRNIAVKWLQTRVSIYHLQLWTDKALLEALKQTGFKLLYFRRTRELSWPVERYVEVYLEKKYHAPLPVVLIAKLFSKVLFSTPWLTRNKAICAAVKIE